VGKDGSLFVTIFHVSLWQHWDKSNILVAPTAMPFWYAYYIVNILTDSSILTLPIREVIKLPLPRREKSG
jgi:hypothetical protein